MEAALKNVFLDVHRWQKNNKHDPSADELLALKDATRHIRRYGFNGLMFGGGSGFLAIHLAGWPKFGRKLGVVGSGITVGIYGAAVTTSAIVGAAIGLNWSGPGCLLRLVAIPNSPLADEARRSVLKHRDALRSPNRYIKAFPEGWDADKVVSAPSRTPLPQGTPTQRPTVYEPPPEMRQATSEEAGMLRGAGAGMGGIRTANEEGGEGRARDKWDDWEDWGDDRGRDEEEAEAEFLAARVKRKGPRELDLLTSRERHAYYKQVREEAAALRRRRQLAQGGGDAAGAQTREKEAESLRQSRANAPPSSRRGGREGHDPWRASWPGPRRVQNADT